MQKEIDALEAEIELLERRLMNPAPWAKMMQGVRVEGDKVIIATKDNDTARILCGALLGEKE